MINDMNNDYSLMKVITDQHYNDSLSSSSSKIQLQLPEPCCSPRTILGWSDIPCQGEQMMETYDYSSGICSLTPPSLHSPTSSIVHDLHLLADGTTTTTTTASLKDTKANRKNVSFSPIIQIRTHEMELGDHPGCVGGMALSCGWGHTETELIDLDIHEENSTKRRMQQLHMGYSARRKRLQAATGLSGSQLLQAEYNLRCRNQAQQQQQKSQVMSTGRRVVMHQAPTLQH